MFDILIKIVPIVIIFSGVVYYLVKILPVDNDCIPIDKPDPNEQNITNYISIIESFCTLNNLHIHDRNNIFNNTTVKVKYNGSTYYDDFCYFQNNDSIIFYKKYYSNINYQEIANTANDIIFHISRNMIQYFIKDGAISYTNKVVNEGKNVSVSGAILGSVIAGNAGTIIGAQKDSNKLNNVSIKHDETHTYVYYKDRDNVKVLDVQGINFYTFILQTFPEKEYRYLTNNSESNLHIEDDDSFKRRLNKVEQLYKDNIITEEEYLLKRANILEEI